METLGRTERVWVGWPEGCCVVEGKGGGGGLTEKLLGLSAGCDWSLSGPSSKLEVLCLFLCG